MKTAKILLLLIFLVSNVYADEENKTTVNISKNSYGNEVNKLSLEFVMATEQIKGFESNKNIGQYTSLKTSLMYFLSSNDEMRLFNSYVIEDYENYKDSKYFELLEAMYRRKSIFNHSEHGFNMDLELKHALVVDKDIRKLWGFTSESIPQLIFKKKFENSMGIEFKIRHHFYHRNSLKPYTLTNEDRLYFSFYKMFNHSLILNTELKYRHKFYTGPHYSYEYNKYMGKGHEDLTLHPGILYIFNRQVLLEGYLETKLNDSIDTRTVGNLAKDQLILGGALYLTAF